jgi:hypothetical protein
VSENGVRLSEIVTRAGTVMRARITVPNAQGRVRMRYSTGEGVEHEVEGEATRAGHVDFEVALHDGEGAFSATFADESGRVWDNGGTGYGRDWELAGASLLVRRAVAQWTQRARVAGAGADDSATHGGRIRAGARVRTTGRDRAHARVRARQAMFRSYSRQAIGLTNAGLRRMQ